MPIYAYRCSACGHGADVMQKMSDAPLTVCTACGQPTFTKQITAAGFQLKGSGWYATDFKNNSKGGKTATTDKPSEKAAEKSGEKSAEKSAEKPAEKAADTSAGKSGETKPAAHACGSGACS